MTTAAASVQPAADVRRGRLFIVLAALAWSSAGILQRELTVPVATQVGGRALFAVLAILAYVAISERGAVWPAFRATGRAGLLLAAAMAVASGSFVVALNHATVANVLFMQALAPVLAAALGRLVGERVAPRTWLAMAVALGGVALMAGGPGRPDALGLGLSLLMSCSFAVALVVTRQHRHVSMAPATCLSQVLVLAVAAPFATPGAVGPGDLGLLVALGVGQIGLGLVFMTIGGRLIPAAEVAVISLLEVVLGPLWVWTLLGERPGAATLAGGLVVLGAVAVQARAGAPAEAAPPP